MYYAYLPGLNHVPPAQTCAECCRTRSRSWWEALTAKGIGTFSYTTPYTPSNPRPKPEPLHGTDVRGMLQTAAEELVGGAHIIWILVGIWSLFFRNKAGGVNALDRNRIHDELRPRLNHMTSVQTCAGCCRPRPKSWWEARYTLNPAPHSLHPAPCTTHPTSYTQHPATHTLHPTPYTLHPTTPTPHPTP